MVPVSEFNCHGYRLKTQFNHLLPQTFGRPLNYVLSPYCLPSHDIMFKKAMARIEEMDETERSYFGGHNRTFM